MTSNASVEKWRDLNEKGRRYAATGKHVMAGMYYLKAIESAPNQDVLYFNLGQLHACCSQLEKATLAYRKAVHLNPYFAEAWTNLAAVLLKQSCNQGAVHAAMVSLSIRTEGNEEAWFNLNTALRRVGKQAESVDMVWRELMARKPSLDRPIHVPLVTSHPSSSPSPDHITVVCVKWGTKYGPEYVNKLQRGVVSHLHTPHSFICYTDDSQGLSSSVTTRPLPDSLWKGWWNKAFLFADGDMTGLANTRVLYIDLDTVIVGDITDIGRYNGDFLIWGTGGLSNEGREGGYNSSVMSWRGGWGRNIYEGLCVLQKELPSLLHRFDHWLEMVVPEAPLLQQVFPGQCVEYMGHAQNDVPKGARIISFPLDPKPHKAVKTCHWLSEKWI